jgi:hypothetical protein
MHATHVEAHDVQLLPATLSLGGLLLLGLLLPRQGCGLPG